MKWLIKFLIKPVIGPIKKAVELCDKLTNTIDKLIITVNSLPLEQGYKEEVLKSLNIAKSAVGTVKSVLVKILGMAGETASVVSEEQTIEASIEAVKKLL